ncbi:unnamed protein product [Vicia faba]|uniref:Uncharacterized protein n=1 Tax=Vicia faba TaxID=3906 RepID=A0AAV0YZ95_VICFA|nr:unnamed protein product [Vicia faba]
MDPNQFHYQQAMFNFMQNYQNHNPQNSQIPSMPTNPAIFFPSPNNPNMYHIPQMNSNSMEFSTQVSPFSTQVGTQVVKKNLESNLQGMRIYFLSNHGSMFQRIQLWELIKRLRVFG